MKWYNSVKVKLLGFFISISIVFLVAIVIAFFFIRDKNLNENVLKEATLSTSEIISFVKQSQTKAEELVLALASVSSEVGIGTQINPKIITSMLSADKNNSNNIVSATICYRATSKKREKKMFYFSVNDNNSFNLVKNVSIQKEHTYIKNDFYTSLVKDKEDKVFWSDVYEEPMIHTRIISVTAPMYQDDKFIGFAAINMKVGNNTKKFWDYLDAKNMYFMMVDSQGNFIGRSARLNKCTNENNIYKVNHCKLEKILNIVKADMKVSAYPTYIDKDIRKSIRILANDPILNEDSILGIYHFPYTHWSIIIGIPKKQLMAKNDNIFYTILAIVVIFTLFASIIGYLLLQNFFVRPIQSINEQLKSNIKKDNLHFNILGCHDKSEIGVLVENLNHRTRALEIARANEALEIEKRSQHEKMLEQQSKMAAMGEMMDAVAHQWKQPLNALSMYSEIIKSDFDDGTVDKAYVDQFRDDIQLQIDHMVNTLDEFRTFFRPNKEHEVFSLLSVIHSVLFLTKDDLLKNAITVNIEQKDHIDVDGSANEFKHLLLNIINNAKDAFIENNIENRTITIRLLSNSEGQSIEIEDNAGGIPYTIINDIFKANVTSKAKHKGTGIGLYMSTQIATKHNATLSVENMNDGACFILTFNKLGLDNI